MIYKEICKREDGLIAWIIEFEMSCQVYEVSAPIKCFDFWGNYIEWK